MRAILTSPVSRPDPPRVLVTGASGFIGRHLVPLLAAQGYEVHGVARRVFPPEPVTDPAVKWHEADLLAPGAARSVARSVRATHLVHLAWNVTHGRFWSVSDNLDWVAASLELHAGFVEAGGRRAVFVGSCAEYDWRHDLLDEATTPCQPATLYGTAKHALHLLLRAAAPQSKLSLAWARLFFLYGPHEPLARVVPYVMASILRNQPALCGDGRAERDFMNVADVAGALAATLNSDYEGPVNIASGKCVPLREVIETAATCLGRPDLVRFGARATPPGEPPRLAAATAILNGRVGFRPVIGLRDGLAATALFWREQLALPGAR